jgi:hypothetical protein
MGLALGGIALLLVGCGERAEPQGAKAAGPQQVTLHVPEMTRRLDLA